MIAPHCDHCGSELVAYGALVFGPPNEASQTSKWHLCTACYSQLRGWMSGATELVVVND